MRNEMGVSKGDRTQGAMDCSIAGKLGGEDCLTFGLKVSHEVGNMSPLDVLIGAEIFFD